MRALFDRQHGLSRQEPAPDAEARIKALGLLRSMILDNEAALAAAVSEDFGGRSPHETRLLEVVPTLNAIRHARGSVRGWMRPRRRPVDIAFQPAKAWVRYEPLGVIGVISPWNYPLLLSIAPLVDALAAGNRVMLKPSELTPRVSALLQALIGERYDADQVAVVTGGPETAQAFSTLPFDHLLFTGSTEVGRKVMRAAAENLTPVTLELGGKSPAVVCPGYPVDKAARSIAFGKFVNAGQTCIAPDYVLVPEASAPAFAEAVMAYLRRAYPSPDTSADYAAMISQRHYDRLEQMVAEARAAGATVLTHDAGRRGEGRKFPPTVVLGPAEGRLMQEEIFGPVLPIVTYDSLEAATAYIRERPRPLALYAFSDDAQARGRVLDQTISGGVTLNGTLLHIAQDSLPFGGVGPSGMGAYHGVEGFRRFSHARGVHQIGAFNAFERLGPPFGALAATLGRILSRR